MSFVVVQHWNKVEKAFPYTASDAMHLAQKYADETDLVHQVFSHTMERGPCHHTAYPNKINVLRHRLHELRNYARWMQGDNVQPGDNRNPMRAVVKAIDLADWWLERTKQTDISPYARSGK